MVPYEKAHVEIYHKWMEDPDILQATASEPLSMEKEYEMQESWRDDADKLTFIVLSAEKIEEGKSEHDSMIGDVNLFLNDPEDDQAGEIEVMIADHDSRKKGCATEAVKLMMGFCYDKIHISRFIAKIGKHNLKSYSLFKNKLKYRFESESEIFEEFTMELFMDEKGRRVINIPFQELIRNPNWMKEDNKPYMPPSEEKLMPVEEPKEEEPLKHEPEKMFLCVKYDDDEDSEDDGDNSEPKKAKLHFGGLKLKEKKVQPPTSKDFTSDDFLDDTW